MTKTAIKIAISIVISALFVWLAARGVDWRGLSHALAEVRIFHLFVYFLILSAIQVVRIHRWGILLRPLGHVVRSRLYAAGSVGIMALVLLPFRLGEFARPLLISERGNISASAALATVVVERVVDSLFMAGLLAAMLFFAGTRLTGHEDLLFWSLVIAAAFLGILGLLIIAYFKRQAAVSLLRRLTRPLPEKLAGRLCGMFDAFLAGQRALLDRRLLFSFLSSTLLYWGMAGLGMYYMFGAFRGLEHLGPFEAFTVLSLLCVGLMIPAGPGMVGNFHYFVKLGLGLFLPAQLLATDAMAYAVVVHAMQLGQQTLWGLFFVVTGRIGLSRLLPEGRAELGESSCTDS